MAVFIFSLLSGLRPGPVGLMRREPRVWPHLMQAGMQLTMFGLGLTNSQGSRPRGPGLTPVSSTATLQSWCSSAPPVPPSCGAYHASMSAPCVLCLALLLLLP